MKTTLLLIIGFILFSSVSAQTYTLNWGTSFSPAWASGTTSGNALNIGGSGINCTVNITKSGGAFTSVGGPATPAVSGTGVVVGGSTSNIQVALDYNNPSQYTTITFTFSAVVYNVKFNIADIDRLTNTSNSYFDRVTVSGTLGSTTVLPVLAKYDSITDPNFFSISGNVAQVNSTSGMSGNTASSSTDQRGTVIVDFGGKSLTSLTIKYDNLPGVASDPGPQFIAVGNLSFYRSIPLPVHLTSFEGQGTGDANTLKWNTVNETAMAWYAVERSETGDGFTEVGRVTSLNSLAPWAYTFTDKGISRKNYYYRLKMTSTDGSYMYSKVVLVGYNSQGEVKVFPSVFSSSVTVRLPSAKEELTQVQVTDMSGKTVYLQPFQLTQGMNDLPVQLSSGLARGQYVVRLSNRSQSMVIIKQ